ncbi:MAG TPA: PDDEXK nuclease domain-containing protein [Solirubrobacteraceae bacterium]|jgi:predicted nuclease of restriction endonuclease-like (RecB) superfamily|nr:PDDEXK nuclease domain-containing protein [Solirubrobacteraceae bacterium]
MRRNPVRLGVPEVDAVIATTTYHELIERLKQRIRESQSRAARAVNTELVMLYWSIGREILEQQQASGWGDDVVGRIAQDLAADTGSPRGFSRRNLFYMRRFARMWPEREKVPSVMAQITWTAHRLLLDRFSEDSNLYAWYAAKSVANRWSVRQLQAQIHLRLHERQGAAVSNFAEVLAPPDAQTMVEATKDPYVFDFLELAEDTQERHLEQALIDDIQNFLTELGSGFALYGRQRALLVGNQEYFVDLLFYHHTLRRFVVIELKVGAFRPEYVSKMNFYLNALDEQLRRGDDRESVGIILCAERDEVTARFALHRVYAPIAVSTWMTEAPQPALPPVEVTDDVPKDLAELNELEEVRSRLIDRVTRRTPEILEGQAKEE